VQMLVEHAMLVGVAAEDALGIDGRSGAVHLVTCDDGASRERAGVKGQRARDDSRRRGRRTYDDVCGEG